MLAQKTLGCITALQIPDASKLPAKARGLEKNHNMPSILLKEGWGEMLKGDLRAVGLRAAFTS